MAGDWIVAGGNGIGGAEFAASLEGLGASISARTNTTTTTIALSTPLSSAQRAIGLLNGVIGRPTLDKEDFDLLRLQSDSALRQQNDNPSSVASRIMARELMGVRHPLALRLTAESLDRLTPENVKAAAMNMLAKGYKMYAAGGPDPKTADTLLAELPPSSANLPKDTSPPIGETKPRLIIVDRPGAVQTVIQFGMPSVSRGNPEYLPLALAQTALGGSFTSRLNQNLREAKGYTYGAGARINAYAQGGWITLSSSVRADVSGPALAEFMKEIKRVESGDFSEAEGTKSAQQIRTDLVTNFSSVESIVDTAIAWDSLELGLGGLDTYMAALPRVKASQVNTVASKYIRSERAIIVMVGDKAGILKQISGMALPMPEIMNP
jgi:zinc protease